MEQTLLDTNRAPETPDDFDRLLVSRPNSSAVWVQYMAFYLHTAEVDKARGVAERALRTISFRYTGTLLDCHADVSLHDGTLPGRSTRS